MVSIQEIIDKGFDLWDQVERIHKLSEFSDKKLIKPDENKMKGYFSQVGIDHIGNTVDPIDGTIVFLYDQSELENYIKLKLDLGEGDEQYLLPMLLFLKI